MRRDLQDPVFLPRVEPPPHRKNLDPPLLEKPEIIKLKGFFRAAENFENPES